MSVAGWCFCGCGHPTAIASNNDRSKGWIKGQPLRFVVGHNLAAENQKKAAAAVGSRTLSGHGYVCITQEDGSREYEHVLVATKALGRPLRNFGTGHPDTEVVHHVDGVKTNNAPTNLLICTHSYHTALHHRLEQSSAWPEFPRVVRNIGSSAI